MNPQEFATKIREKYPDGVSSDGRNYADIPDEELTQKIIDKYPVYKSQVLSVNQLAEKRSEEAFKPIIPAKTGEGMIKAGLKTAVNIPSSAWQMGKGTLEAIKHPIETVKGLGALGDALVRGGGRVVGEKFGMIEDKDTDQEQTFNQIADALKAHFGSTEALQRTLTNDPLLIPTLITPFLKGGTVSKVAQATKIPQAITKTSALPGKAAEKLVTSSLKIKPTDAKKIKLPNMAGKPYEQWLLERKITGTPEQIADKLDEIATTAMAKGDTMLDDAAIKGENWIMKPTYQMPKSANDALSVLENTFSGTVGNEAKMSKIAEMKSRETVSLSDMNEIKRMIDQNLNLWKTTGEAKSGAQAEGLRNLRNDVKEFIEIEAEKAGAPGIKELRKETQVAKEISKAIRSAETSRGGNRIGSLSDMIVGAVTGAGLGIETAAGIVIAKKILENPRLKIEVANQLKKLSPQTVDKLEKAVQAGKKIDDSSKMIIQQIFEKAKKTVEEFSKEPKGGLSTQAVDDLGNPLPFKGAKQISEKFFPKTYAKQISDADFETVKAWSEGKGSDFEFINMIERIGLQKKRGDIPVNDLDDWAKTIVKERENMHRESINADLDEALAGKKPSEVAEMLKNKTPGEIIDEYYAKKNPVLPKAGSGNIDERLAPLANKNGMVKVYRASSDLPSDNKFSKDTFVATKPENARYYAESHYRGDPKDIKITSFEVPATLLKRGGSNDAWQLVDDYAPKPSVGQTADLVEQAKKFKTEEEFVKDYTQSNLMDLSNYEKHRWHRAIPGEYGGQDDIINILKNPSGYLTDIKYTYPEIYKKIITPGENIKVYRAVPKNAPDKILEGDYLALIKDYAEMHGESVLKGQQGVDYKIITQEIPKKDVIWGQADFAEWTYSPKKLREKYPNGLSDVWKQAHNK